MVGKEKEYEIMINIAKVGSFVKGIVGVSRKTLKAENQLLSKELGATKEKLATVTKDLFQSKQAISEAEAMRAQVFATSTSTNKRYDHFIDNIDKIAQSEVQLKSSLSRIGNNTATAEDYKVVNQYSKRLKNHYHRLSKDPQFYERGEFHRGTILKDADPRILDLDFADRNLKVPLKTDSLAASQISSVKAKEAARKALDSVHNSGSVAGEAQNFVERYYHDVYPQTNQLRQAVLEKQLKMNMPKQ